MDLHLDAVGGLSTKRDPGGFGRVRDCFYGLPVTVCPLWFTAPLFALGFGLFGLPWEIGDSAGVALVIGF